MRLSRISNGNEVNNKMVRIGISLSEEQDKALEKAAEEEGIKPTTYAHDALISALKKRKFL